MKPFVSKLSVVGLAACLCVITSPGATARQQRQSHEQRMAVLIRGPWLSAADLPPALLKELEQQESGCDTKEPAMLAASFHALDVNLSKDSDGLEMVVQGESECMCGATGRCPFWVFRLTPRGTENLLTADSVQEFAIKNTRTNGYRDLVLLAHRSAFSSRFTIYQFDGERYQAAGCYVTQYEYKDPDGHFRVHKRPRFIPCAYADD